MLYNVLYHHALYADIPDTGSLLTFQTGSDLRIAVSQLVLFLVALCSRLTKAILGHASELSQITWVPFFSCFGKDRPLLRHAYIRLQNPYEPQAWNFG